jgi:predicted nucleic acid-binding protein
MPGKVVDASVIGAWCFREPRAAEAEALMEAFQLVAPALLPYELVSIARKKAAARPADLTLLEEGLMVGLALPITYADVDQQAVLRLALDHRLSTYDASYLHLARTLALPLATFDARLARAAPTL